MRRRPQGRAFTDRLPELTRTCDAFKSLAASGENTLLVRSFDLVDFRQPREDFAPRRPDRLDGDNPAGEHVPILRQSGLQGFRLRQAMCTVTKRSQQVVRHGLAMHLTLEHKVPLTAMFVR